MSEPLTPEERAAKIVEPIAFIGLKIHETFIPYGPTRDGVIVQEYVIVLQEAIANAIRAAVAELEAENARLREDAARLDWLDVHTEFHVVHCLDKHKDINRPIREAIEERRKA